MLKIAIIRTVDIKQTFFMFGLYNCFISIEFLYDIIKNAANIQFKTVDCPQICSVTTPKLIES